MLSRRVSAQRTRNTLDRAKKISTLNERQNRIKPFLEEWNRWRAFYYPALGYDVKIKNSGELTKAENCIKLISEKKLETGIAIACVFKLFKERRYTRKPNFSNFLNLVEEIYEDFYDKVVADVDARDYQEGAIE